MFALQLIMMAFAICIAAFGIAAFYFEQLLAGTERVGASVHAVAQLGRMATSLVVKGKFRRP